MYGGFALFASSSLATTYAGERLKNDLSLTLVHISSRLNLFLRTFHLEPLEMTYKEVSKGKALRL